MMKKNKIIVWVLFVVIGLSVSVSPLQALDYIDSQEGDTTIDITPPGNVTNFTAQGLDGQVVLSWTNPADADFVRTLIVKKIGSAPINEDDGDAIYEGTDTTFTDTELVNGAAYYYTAYTFDGAPNYSSGVMVTGTPVEGKNQINIPKPANVSSLPPPLNPNFPSGSLILDQGVIYFVAGSLKIPFTSMQVFRGLGFSISNVVKADSSSFVFSSDYNLHSSTQEHPWGSWLINKGVVYYSTAEGMVPAPTWDIFLNNGGQAKFILTMNKADLGVLKVHPNLPVLTENDQHMVQ